MNCYSITLSRAVGECQLLGKPQSDDELFTVTPFPWIKLCRNDFDETFRFNDHKGPHSEFFMDTVIATSKSYGIVVNSFYELESVFLDYWNQNYNPRAWCVGPLCLAKPPSKPHQEKPTWLQWLDQKLSEGRSVLYVAFGTQAEIPAEQFREIAVGLEKSNLNFLWVVRTKPGMELEEGFEERVKEKGMVVREWVDQRVILEHDSVKGFLSHCGWNSVMESICAKVPILAWPMMAEQHLNARMVVEEVKIGLRVETVDGTVRGFVKWEGLEKMVKELMEGEMGINLSKNVKELGDMARKAMEEGGSSGKTLDLLVNDVVCAKKRTIT
ncbi:UDP-glucuronosyl/UDP-glucosyltransferase [Dillenia turbinata]|uniref:UDP-glucuronosyl/UDP-glucosyltransferase n=1 Tax=Dillenia turbinata TaxID=194707 RepID=A0AAN8VJ77_9MAGN